MTFATGPDDLPDIATMRSMSGLEFMCELLAGRLSAPPMAAELNYRLHSVEDGRVTFRGAPQFRHVNPMGILHGGWYGTLLNSAMSCAVLTKVPRGSTHSTLEYKVTITRPLPPGIEVRAIGQVSHAGRTTGFATGEIRGVEDDRLYATGSSTCQIMPLPPA